MARSCEKLTDKPGYDAEATVQWNGKKIIYTSKASGDLDLWSTDLDGSHKKQITQFTGYDGGAVFSRDGRKIVWRAHHPQPGPDLDKYKQLLGQKPDRADEDGTIRRERGRFGREDRSRISDAQALRRNSRLMASALFSHPTKISATAETSNCFSST